jgi:very-short-patch-repair endonuclease
VDALDALNRLGGVAEAHELLRWTSRRRIRRAVRRGEIERLARGRYTTGTASAALAVAGEMGGAVVCLRSAAAHHGWKQKHQPERPDVALRRGRRLDPEWRGRVTPHWFNVAEDDRRSGVTGPIKTVIDCARRLPFDEALAIADSALRASSVSRQELDRVRAIGAGAAAVRRVLRHADARSANPFESVLRALALEAGLDVEPQVAVDLGTGVVHPDLASVSRRLVLEADSWTHHATRTAHARDCARYNLLSINGWLVLRFTWEQVMTQPAYVRWVLSQVDRFVERPEVFNPLARPA